MSWGFFKSILASGCLALASCSVHPLPEDTTGVDTALITRKIRCEAKDAVYKHVIELFEKDKSNTAEKATVLAGLRRSPDYIATYDRRKLTGRLGEIVDRYDGAAISYEFTFNLKEENTIEGGIGIGRAWSDRALDVGTGAKSYHSRSNERNFRIADSFIELFQNPELHCEEFNRQGKFPQTKDFSYPIRGNIGLYEMIDTFLELDEAGGLENPVKDDRNVPSLADTIEFETTISGGAGADPLITISPVADSLRLTKLTLNASASRQDKHKVIVAVVLPPEERAAPGKTKAATASSKSRQKAGKASANSAVDYQILRGTVLTNKDALQNFLNSQ